MTSRIIVLLSAVVLMYSHRLPKAQAELPHVSYVFPAGGQQGTKVSVKVGGHFLHEGAPFEVFGKGIQASDKIVRCKTTWFEGPLIPMPASQRKEDYPKDYDGQIVIDKNAQLGTRYWRVSTSQGVTPRMKFVIGNLPEIVEHEFDGTPIPVVVKPPLTINGRIFPREDIDVWTFLAKKGESYSCEVVANRIGSPLDSRLEIRGPTGRPVIENVDAFGVDSFVRFVAPMDGIYSCRIHDINFQGLQNFVYRLTIRRGAAIDAVFPLGGQRGSRVQVRLFGQAVPASPIFVLMPKSGQTFRWTLKNEQANRAPLTFDLDDLPEVLEVEPNDSLTSDSKISSVAVPQTLNGIIDQAGDEDHWKIVGNAGDSIQFEVFANRLGTALDSVLEIVDEDGKSMVKNDDAKGGQTDSLLKWKIPKGGPWFLKIRDQLTTRGGPQFVYRIKATKSKGPSFRIVLPADALTVTRGTTANLKLQIERSSDFKEAIELEVAGLPKGVTVENTTIAKNRPSTQLVFKAADLASLGLAELTITGVAEIKDKDKKVIATIQHVAEFPVAYGEPPIDGLSLFVAIATPFKFLSPFESKYASRGTEYSRNYQIERTDFAGEIEIEMADRQVRHLQGVTGNKVVVPAGGTDFKYTVALPPAMEIGRTSRTTLMASAFVKDETGKQHRVSYTSIAQDDQIIVLVDPVKLSVSSQPTTIRVVPGKTVKLPIQVNRGTGLDGAVQVELIVPDHIQGVSARSITVAQGQQAGQLSIQFEPSAKKLGPFNMPLVIRATLRINDSPIVGESHLAIRQ